MSCNGIFVPSCNKKTTLIKCHVGPFRVGIESDVFKENDYNRGKLVISQASWQPDAVRFVILYCFSVLDAVEGKKVKLWTTKEIG